MLVSWNLLDWFHNSHMVIAYSIMVTPTILKHIAPPLHSSLSDCHTSCVSILFNTFILKIKNLQHTFIHPLKIIGPHFYIVVTNIYFTFSGLCCSTWLMRYPLVKEIKWNSDLSLIWGRCWEGPTACIWWSAVCSHGRSESWVFFLHTPFYHKKWTGKWFH